MIHVFDIVLCRTKQYYFNKTLTIYKLAKMLSRLREKKRESRNFV